MTPVGLGIRRRLWLVALVALFAGIIFVIRSGDPAPRHASRPDPPPIEEPETAPKSTEPFDVERALELARVQDTEGLAEVVRTLRSGTPEAALALETIARALVDPERDLFAAELIQAVGPAALPAVRRAFHDGLPMSAGLLHELLPVEEREAMLAAALQSEHGSVKEEAAYMLRERLVVLTDPLLRAACVGMRPLPEPDAYFVEPPYQIFKFVGSAESEVFGAIYGLELPVPRLVSLLGDRDPRVRCSAIDLFVNAAERTTRDVICSALRRALEDPSPRVREIAIQHEWPELQPEVVALLCDRTQPVFVRSRAAETLGCMRGDHASYLVPLLEDDDPAIRRSAAIGLRGSEEAVPALLPHLRDPDLFVRLETAVALLDMDDIDTAGARATLVALLDAKEPKVVVRAALVLAPTGKDHAREITAACMRFMDTPWRSYVSVPLGYLEEAALPFLTAAIDNERGVARIEAAWALGRLGKRAVTAQHALARMAESKDQGARRAAGAALASILGHG